MGAANAVRAYRAWGHLDDRPLRLLVYMALVARDGDAAPWYGQGHEALAMFALNRTPDDAGLRAVRRSLTPLFAAGALETVKRATYGKRGTSQVHYRLWLDGPRPQDAERPVDNPVANPVENPAPQDADRPMAGESIGRSLSVHRTLTGRPQDAERPTKEEEEEEERSTEEQISVRRDVEDTPPRAVEPSGHRVNLNGHAAVAALRPTLTELAGWQAERSRRERGATP